MIMMTVLEGYWKKIAMVTGIAFGALALGTAINVGYNSFLGNYAACTTIADCDTDNQYCLLSECGGAGYCAANVASCDSDPGPVCACDGTIYHNVCQVALAKESADPANECLTASQDFILYASPTWQTAITSQAAGDANTATAITGTKFWTTFYNLSPIDGFYGLRTDQDSLNNDPLVNYSMNGWTTEAINGYEGGTRPPVKWLFDLQQSGLYSLYVRRGDDTSPTITAKIDEAAISLTGAGALDKNACTPCYDWWKIGQANLSTGVHWLDLTLQEGTFDAIVFSADTDFSPDDTDVLNIDSDLYIADPTTYGVRYARAEDITTENIDTDTNTPYWIFAENKSDEWNEDIDDYQLLDTDLVIVSAKNHFSSADFQIVAGPYGSEFETYISDVYGPDSDPITDNEISVRIARPVNLQSWHHVSDEYVSRRDNTGRKIALMLVHDDRATNYYDGVQGGSFSSKAYGRLSPYENRNVWITINPSGALQNGTYTGNVHVKDIDNPWIHTTIPIHVSVNNVSLLDNNDSNCIFYKYSANDVTNAIYYAGANKFSADLDYIARLGFDKFTSYPGVYTYSAIAGQSVFNQTDMQAVYAKGLNEAVIHMTPTLGSMNATKATQMLVEMDSEGFNQTLVEVFQFDEPDTDGSDFATMYSRIMHTVGLEATIQATHPSYELNSVVTFNDEASMMDTDSYDFLQLVEVPIISFLPPFQDYVDLAISYGNYPKTYWTTQATAPYAQRSSAGFEAQARGFSGVCPFAYAFEHANTSFDSYDLFDSKNKNVISYPDSAGNPIPTRRGEALGEGLTDARYYQLLETWVAETQGCGDYGDTDTEPGASSKAAKILFGVISTPYENTKFSLRKETAYGPTKRRADIVTAVENLQTYWGTTDPLDTDIDTASCVP